MPNHLQRGAESDALTPTSGWEKPQWGKKWGKNQLREKTISHKKIQPPISDWIS
ncbi:hypothetical protein [Pseudomonas umsongensis]|uniref:hypothetical protein n=1 Tax=Pseudomonas umsongensis TaxID=198618 RepID=UPI00200A7034|nr:hypothetical protein [Pseudomonas umsongensis]MCK8682593.1 hypothetical protein [Pseudomonas umsongensis]